jgi:uncharacterized protein YkuJ
VRNACTCRRIQSRNKDGSEENVTQRYEMNGWPMAAVSVPFSNDRRILAIASKRRASSHLKFGTRAGERLIINPMNFVMINNRSFGHASKSLDGVDPYLDV